MADMKVIRPLLKLLLEVGIASRRKISDAIRQGKVQVNGIVIEDFSYLVDSSSAVVIVEGRKIDLKSEPKIYLMLNKPAGVLSTVKDSKYRKTVIDILPEKYRSFRLYPVGRLDKNSTGLLLLSNDGQLTYELTHPKFEHEKEYLIQIRQRLQPEAIREIGSGIQLDDGITYPAKIKELRPTYPFNYSIIIHEGRKRQVRRMFDKLGYHVLALKRVRMGTLELGELKEGEIRELSHHEVKMLLSNVC
jgi:23S rRNA pseudouridine2605 synthase